MILSCRSSSSRPPAGTRLFRRRVLQSVRSIPVGRVATYGDVAARAGRPRAWRAVGTIMANCQLPDVPCHRVIAAGGRLGGFGAGHVGLKRELLRAEGLRVSGTRVRDFDQVRVARPLRTQVGRRLEAGAPRSVLAAGPPTSGPVVG